MNVVPTQESASIPSNCIPFGDKSQDLIYMTKQNGSSKPLSGKRRQPKKWVKRFLIILSLLLFLIFLSRLFLISTISKVQVLASQVASETIPLDVILIKEEKVVNAPSSGRLHLVVLDGKRLEMGAKAAEIIVAGEASGDYKIDISTSATGILCTHLDGLESILTPQNITVAELKKIEKTVVGSSLDGTNVSEWQPVFKIIDNLSPVSIYASIPKAALADGYPDKPETLQASWENHVFALAPSELIDNGDMLEGFYQIADYPEALVHQRKVQLMITARQLKGLLVPDKAVVYRDSEPGIYLAVKKKAQWTPVAIEGELAGKVAVSGEGISEGTRFISNPVLLREGWPIE
jgi:putative membrane fusion protein